MLSMGLLLRRSRDLPTCSSPVACRVSPLCVSCLEDGLFSVLKRNGGLLSGPPFYVLPSRRAPFERPGRPPAPRAVTVDCVRRRGPWRGPVWPGPRGGARPPPLMPRRGRRATHPIVPRARPVASTGTEDKGSSNNDSRSLSSRRVSRGSVARASPLFPPPSTPSYHVALRPVAT